MLLCIIRNVKCLVKVCKRSAVSRRWCGTHYAKFLRAGLFKIGPQGRPVTPSLVSTKSQSEIAQEMGVSRQRVHQMMHKEAHRARALVGAAVKAGTLVRPDRCQRCGELRSVQGHHDDYGEPLAVQWLCSECHSIVHPHHPYSKNKTLGRKLKAEAQLKRRVEWASQVNNAPLIKAIRNKTKALRLSLEMVDLSSVRISGSLCALRSLTVRANGNVQLRPVAVNGHDFVLLYERRSDQWMVMPARECPKKETGFALNEPEAEHRGGKRYKHHYRNYFEAWNLLIKESKA